MIYTITDALPITPTRIERVATYSLDDVSRLIYVSYHRADTFVDNRGETEAILTKEAFYINDERFEYNTGYPVDGLLRDHLTNLFRNLLWEEF